MSDTEFRKAYGNLPPDFVAEGLKLAKGAALFGIPLDQLHGDELLAAAAHGWHEEYKLRQELRLVRSHQFDFFKGK